MSDVNNFSPEEKQKVLDFWNLTVKNTGNPPPLSEIVFHLSDGATSDPRIAPWGRKVRAILSVCDLKAKTKQWEKVDEIILTEEQKEFIKNNIKDNKPYHIAKDLFPNKKIMPLGKEVRVINEYLNEIGEYKIWKEDTIVEGEEYVPPRTFFDILKKVNLYLHAELSTQNVTAYDKKCLETTIQFLHAPRFVQEINGYKTLEKRITFESEFIRAVYNKPDLTPEEISLTINWCSDIIEVSDSKKQAEKLKAIMDQKSDDSDGKFTMSLVEAIGEINKHINEVLKRQKDIYVVLNKKRSDRKAENDNKVGSLTALFEWASEESNRQKLLDKAKLQEQIRENEVSRMETLDDIILLSLGMKRDEAVK